MAAERSESILDAVVAELKAYGHQAVSDGITTFDRGDRTGLYEAMGRLQACNHVFRLITRLRASQEPQ